jgi:hypothetical protein
MDLLATALFLYIPARFAYARDETLCIHIRSTIFSPVLFYSLYQTLLFCLECCQYLSTETFSSVTELQIALSSSN